MADKVFNGRIIHKNDIEENWGKAINFIPKKSELIIYNPDDTHAQARIKVGDGITKVNDLPFVDDELRNELFDKITAAQNTADSAVTAAANAQTTANNAMPKSGGVFTGGVSGPYSASTNTRFYNACTYNASKSARVAVYHIDYVRK